MIEVAFYESGAREKASNVLNLFELLINFIEALIMSLFTQSSREGFP